MANIGLEGTWTLKLTGAERAVMTLRNGTIQLSMNVDGRPVIAQGVYRRFHANSNVQSRSFSAILQFPNSPGVQYLMAEVESCGPSAGVKLRGHSSAFAGPNRGAGSFTGYLRPASTAPSVNR